MKLNDIPDKPGVYLFMDNKSSVIYIGKAKSLIKRVRSHFGHGNLNSRHISMISQVSTVDFITTKNEKEALILEDQFIKDLKPRYNIALRDDKSYPYLELTSSEDFPSLK
ncbi:GIY-YIG nuclease family protein, partial [Elusimicrobiota bacterium]